MKLSTSSLLAGVTLGSLFSIANAGELKAQTETPQILSSIKVINAAGYRLLSKAEMTEVVGTLIANGTYGVYTIENPNLTVASGIATISGLPGQSNAYIVNYNRTGPAAAPQQGAVVAIGLERANETFPGTSFATVWAAGAQTLGMALYELSTAPNASGWLIGTRTTRNQTGRITSQAKEVLVPAAVRR